MSDIRIIEAISREEIETHFKLRKEVFQREMNIHQRDDFDRYDKDRVCHYYTAYIDDTAVAVARWRENKAGYKIERLCVLKDYRGQGIGTKMMDYLLEVIPKNLHLNTGSPLPTVSFYERFGFYSKGESFWEAGILHRFMKLSRDK